MNNANLGVDNIETKSNTLSASSSKLVAYNTIATAVADTWTTDITSSAEEAWLDSFWEALVEVLPDLGRVGLSRRRQLRGTSMVGAAVMFYGYMGLADRLRTTGEDLSVLEELDDKVTLTADGLHHSEGDTVDWFDYDNPEWTTRGILVPTT